MTALSVALIVLGLLAHDIARRYLARPTAESKRVDELARRIATLETLVRPSR